MASYFRQRRNVQLSLLYYLQTCFTADWSDVTLVKAFKQVYAKDLSLPIVCVSSPSVDNPRLEIGSNTLDPKYLINIQVFARSEAQRDDLADYIVNKVKDGWVHYSHSHASGDSSTLVRVADGRDKTMDFITDNPIEITDSSDPKDTYRHIISIRVRKGS